MSFGDQPIKRKLMFIILGTSGLVLLITSVSFMSYEWLTFRRSLVESVGTLSLVIADNSTAALAFHNESDAAVILSALKADETIEKAALYDAQGQLFAWYPESSGRGAFPVQPARHGYYFSAQHLVFSTPVVEGDAHFGTLYIQAGLGIIYQRFNRYAVMTITILLIAFLAAFIFSNILQKNISRPVMSLANAARFISEKKDYSIRVENPRKDELGMMTQTFNNMLDQIQKTDAGLRKALTEKDILIQEVHHRVKNNLQVILSLFEMQSRYVRKPSSVFEVFEDCKARIRSMSLVHEMLYTDSDLSEVDFAEYVAGLIADLSRSHRRPDFQLDSVIDVADLQLDISKAVPLGLMLSEILTNTFKHAFKDRTHGKVVIKTVEKTPRKLIIADDGPGIPSHVDFNNPTTFGLKIIRLLSEQTSTKVTIDTTNGTAYTIELHGL
ncbi:MAG TPA: histidine kinase dimerization/phosphoacceptor domain -containing protein [Acidobacteriota bacterium]|nr:histidine kinase dimerization/phosphoacceptor domain -containing protein [Acidobacteriota bacterium]